MRRWACAGLLLISTVSGCAPASRAWTDVVRPIGAEPGKPLHFGPWPGPGARTGRFTVLEGSGGEIVRREAEVEGGRWRVLSERDGRPWMEETLEMSPQGDVLLVESVSHDDRVITRFDPPMLVAPAGLAEGETREWRGMLRVHPIDRPGELRDEGEARQEVAWGGRARVRVGSGWVDAVGIRTTLRAGLRAARVETEGWVWVTERDGVVAERARETATFLGLSVRDVRRGLIRR